jgi:hypothetical protein
MHSPSYEGECSKRERTRLDRQQQSGVDVERTQRSAALDASVGRIAGLQASRRTGVRAIAGIPVRARNRLQHRPFQTSRFGYQAFARLGEYGPQKATVRYGIPALSFDLFPRGRRPIVRSEYHVSIFIGHCSHGFGSLDPWYPGGSCA